MPGCQKCWNEAGAIAASSHRSKTEVYMELIDQRDADGEECTPEEQCGELHLVGELKAGGRGCACGKVVEQGPGSGGRGGGGSVNKRQAQFIHANRRALERYGVKLNRVDHIRIVEQIQQGRATFVFKESNARSRFVVTLPDKQEALCIYDKTRKALVTFLPKPLALKEV